MPVLLAVLLLALGAGARSQSPSLPLGFTVDVLAPGLRGPIGLDVLPDGRVLFVEQTNGEVELFSVVSGGRAVIGTVPGLAVSYSRGLLAVVADPGWPTRPFVYVLHTDAAAGDHRISRYTATGDLTQPGSTNVQLSAPLVVLAGIPDARPVNDGGCLRFGRDGMLYVSTGDDHADCPSQDPTTLHGKILRLDVASLPLGATGTAARSQLVAAGNPYAGGPGDVAPLVWAVGLRNPFRFHVDPVSGALLVADVGEALLDEIDVILPGGGGSNLGWPWIEGDQPLRSCAGGAPATAAPVVVQPLGPGFTALVSMGVYRSDASAPHGFGPAYQGSYFYTDHFTGRVWRLQPGPAGYAPAGPAPGQPSASLWATGMSWVTDAVVGPDGALYFCERADSTIGSLRRLRPDAAAFAPFGQGCAGSAGVPVLASSGAPVLGQSFTMDLRNLSAGGLAFGMLGLVRDAWLGAPLPADLAAFGMPGCAGLVRPDALFALAGSSGVAQWSVGIPQRNELRGLAVFVQALVLDAAANVGGAVVSNGGEGVIR